MKSMQEGDWWGHSYANPSKLWRAAVRQLFAKKPTDAEVWLASKTEAIDWKERDAP